MKYIFTLLAMASLSLNIIAQQDSTSSSKLYAGYGLFMNYNLYCWYQKPSSIDVSLSSSGQILNILPGVGLNFWFGDVDHWILSLEGAIEYMPFALDASVYKGLGALSIPILAKTQFPIVKQQSLWLMLHIGAGVQLLHTDIYARPLLYQNTYNPLFAAIVGEIGIHVSAVGYLRQHIREIEFFIRTGAGLLGAVGFNTGLRITFWNRFGK